MMGIILNLKPPAHTITQEQEEPIMEERIITVRLIIFAVYSPDTKKVYLVPINHVKTMTSAMLRLVPTKNKQVKNVRWAKDYELE